MNVHHTKHFLRKSKNLVSQLFDKTFFEREIYLIKTFLLAGHGLFSVEDVVERIMLRHSQSFCLFTLVACIAGILYLVPNFT